MMGLAGRGETRPPEYPLRNPALQLVAMFENRNHNVGLLCQCQPDTLLTLIDRQGHPSSFGSIDDAIGVLTGHGEGFFDYHYVSVVVYFFTYNSCLP